MNESILFSEKQAFRQYWLWFLLLTFNGILVYTMIPYIRNHQFGHLTVPILAVILLDLLFIFARLETKITQESITVHYFPFLRNPRSYPWENIRKATVRKYNPLLGFRGWGVRYRFKGGTAYNVSGQYGLQLEFHDGKRILIGTRKPEQLNEIINQIRQQK